MSLAIIKTGGKQYLVRPGEKLKIEKLVAEIGDKVEFEALLKADGDKVDVGTPILDVKVSGQVIGGGRNRKVTGIKYKPKTREKTKFGHRQHFTEVEFKTVQA